MRLIIDIGATKTLLVAVDKDGQEIARQRFATDDDYPLYRQHLINEARQLVEDTDGELEGIAVGSPGLIDYQTRLVRAFGGNRDWTDVDIAPALEEEFKVPIIIDNDANLGAIGEARRGAGRGYDTVLYITISTGIGTGITYHGKIDPALKYSEAGAMHFYENGKFMQWEKSASGGSFYRKYGRYGREVPVEEAQIWQEYASQVANGFQVLIAIIQPDVIVVGGSMGEHLPKFLPFVSEFLQSNKLDYVKIPPIVQAEHFDEAVINGGIEAINDKLNT